MDAVLHGPALRRVAPDDELAVRALLAEQAARLEIVRRDRLWQWLGGLPSGFGHPSRELWAVWSGIAAVGLVALALVVVGFTRGPFLWSLAALACAALVARRVLLHGPTLRTLEFFAAAEVLPAIVVHAEDIDEHEAGAVSDPHALRRYRLVLLVGFAVDGADALGALDDAAERLRRVATGVEASGLLAALVEALRVQAHDGGRLPADALHPAAEVAFVEAGEAFLPMRTLASRLLFVLADRGRRTPGSTRVLAASFSGNAARTLCERMPWEGA